MYARLSGLLLACCLSAAAWADTAPVAHWDFNEGAGEMLHDKSGNNNHGNIHGAQWVKCGKGYALQFGRNNSYVDFGDNPKLKVTGDFSFSAWIKLVADPYPDPTTNWHLFSWEAYRKSGMSCRVGGGSGQLYFRSSQPDRFQAAYAQTKFSNHTFYHVVMVKKSETMTLFVDGKPDVKFPVMDPTPNNLRFTLSEASQSFSGIMDSARLYRRAVSAGEVVALYEEHASEHGKDVSWLGKFLLTPFIYYDKGQAIVEANFRGVLPLRAGERILVELRQAGKVPLDVRELAVAPESAKEDFVFELGKLAPGTYRVHVSVRTGDNKVRAETSVQFDYPAVPPAPVSPAVRVVAPLPVPPQTPAYAIEIGTGGGFTVRLGNESYPIESSYTYPYGGENRLTASNRTDSAGEKDWKVRVEHVGDSSYRVIAGGKHYRITREIVGQATRILVKDRIENLTAADLGLALDNHIDAKGNPGIDFEALAMPAPPVFLRAGNHGLGLVPLNDVYQLLQRTYIGSGGTCGAKIAGLGVAKGASHTLEWAVYPIGTTDYYDLINAIRRDEGLNGMTVDGCLAMTHAGRWLRELPPDELIRFGGVKYASSGNLKPAVPDHEVSFEGIEFVRYPRQQESLRNNYVEIKKRFPGLKVGFHNAYNIYATNHPEKIFDDSRVIAKSGKHEFYSASPSSFSKERLAQGWAFYPYYPTLTNSFGKELLKSVDVMMDDMGADLVWADGLLSGYGSGTGGFPTSFVSTLDPWDGHTVSLDPATKTISRKWGQIAALGKDVLINYIRKINAKGGRVYINHGCTVARSFAREQAYWVAESHWGEYMIASLHLSPAPHGLAHNERFRTVQAIYDDVRAKLSWGALYTYWWWGGASHLTHRMITADMYPITIEEIHSGYIKGRERMITLHPGVYGWQGDKQLHLGVLYDGRGHPTLSDFLSTTDRSGVRTEMNLRENETAILKRIPVTLQSNSPVNLVVTQYDENGMRLTLNGKGAATFQVKDGAFPIKPGVAYTVKTDTVRTVAADDGGTLCFDLVLDRVRRLTLEPARK